MPENRLGIGYISFPSTVDKDLKIALEDFVARVGDNFNYLYKPQVSTIITNTTLTDLDSIVLVDATSGAKTITLPDAATVTGKQLNIKKIDASANAVTITPAGIQKIDGSSSYSLATQNKYACVVSDGSNWHVISNN